MTDKAIVLIVDDTPEYLQTLANCLKEDYHIKIATNGERCIELAQSDTPPDLILLDVVMQGQDGYETIKKLKENEHTSSIPVIFVTGNDEEKDEEKGFLLGAVDYIAKPIQPAIVRVRVKNQVLLKKQHDDLTWIAMRDPLTGLFNRHYLLEAVGQKMSHAARHKEALCLLVIDLDYFKNINDQFGHLEGDNVLKEVSNLLKESCRKEDISARLGGEEFALVLDNCSIEMAEQKAEKLRKSIEDRFEGQLPVTASIGITILNVMDQSFEELFSRADKALYRAKEQGRNRCLVY